MKSIVFKSTRPAVTRFTTAALLLLALAACNVAGDSGDKPITFKAIDLFAIGVDRGIDLSWDAVTGANSYTVHYSDTSFSKKSDSGIISESDITTDNTSITGLTNRTTYYLLVEAINAAGNILSASRIKSAIANLPAPTKFKATGRNKAIYLSWGAVEGATSYKVYYSKASIDKTADSGVKSKTAITTTNTSITGLAEDTTYYFGVIAINGVGDNSNMSRQKKSATVKLRAPQPSAAASINNSAAVDLSWTALDGVTDYRIYYAKDSLYELGYQKYASVGGKLDVTADTSLTIGDLSIDITYYFVVAANYDGEEKAAGEITADSSYIAELAMGGKHGCVRLNTGGIKCWGKNDKGQLGLGVDGGIKKTATSVSGSLRARQLSAGLNHSCAIDLEGQLHCWGDNDYFQLGLSKKNLDRTSPTLVDQDELDKVSLVTAGYSSTCALAGENNYCWGRQDGGGLGDGVDSEGSIMDAKAPIKRINTAVKQFALGFNSGCARDASNHLWCWGYNAPSQAGDGNNGNNGNDGADADLTSPVKVLLQGGGTSATMLAGGYFHYCVVDEAKKIQCWGSNYSGQLGIDSTTNSNSPQYVLASDSTPEHLTGVSKIATGEYHSCALIEGGTVRCWGFSDSGRIGTSGEANRLIADTDMEGINNAIDIVAGGDFTCALLADKASVKCWGANGSGQLGVGRDIESSYTPVEVAGLRVITIIPEAPPTDLQAKGKNKAIDLTWGKVDGAISYTVYYHTEKFSSTTDSEIQSETVIAATSISITGLKNGTEYFIRLVASNTKGNSALSDEVSAITKLPAPTNLNAIGVYRGVDLSWNAVTGATSYKVYYHTASFDKTSDSEVQSTAYIEKATKTRITGLTNGQTYYFKVVAYTDGASSQPSIAATGTPNLSPPTGLKASSGYQSVALSWNSVSGATGYRVYYHTAKEVSPDKHKHLVSKEVGSTSITISGLNTGVTYYFIVLAYKGKVNSLASSVVTGKPIPGQPTGLQPTSGYQSVALSWNRVSGVDGYRVYYDTTDDVSPSLGKNSGSKVVIGDSTTDTTITGLNNGQIYYFIVVAYQGSSSSSPSLVVSAEPSFAPPTNLNATGVYQAVDLSWDAVTEATSYTVYYHTASFDNTYDSEAKSKTGIKTINTRITGLADNTTYYFRVIAINPSGSSALSQIQSATTKLAPHPSAAASIYGVAAVDLSWDAVSGATGYNIYYAKDSLDDLKGGYQNYAKAEGGKVEATTDTSVTIGDLSADTTYYFVVAANYKGAESAAPELSANSSYIAELAMGGNHSCVRLNTGSIKCWGHNGPGQLGLGDNKDRHTATGVSGLLAKQLSAGYWHSCAIDLSGRLYCWGLNHESSLGLSSYGIFTIPTLLTQANLDEVSLVAAGYWSTCALADGNNYCWGYRSRGALGDGAIGGSTFIAQQIKDITPDVKQFALGFDSGCAIDVSDDLWCWGDNGRGQAGVGTTGNFLNGNYRFGPVKPKLQGSSFATMLAGNYRHYCAVDNDTKMQCWGSNYHGQLGIDSTTDSNSPQYVLASKSDHLSGVSKVATGHKHSCALIIGGEEPNSKVRCWGGRSKIADTDKLGINNAIDIAAGWYHTCVLLKDKARVKCWGHNSYGQLGNGTTSSSATPVAVLGLTDITKLPISIPAQPTKPQATGKNKAIDLTWDAVAGATSYKVYYHTTSFSSTAGLLSKTVLSPALSTSITRLKNAKEYFIRLVASNAKGDSKPSDWVSATTKLPAPTNLNAIGVYQGVDLSWDAVTGATSYEVYYHTASFDSSTKGVKSKTVQSPALSTTSITGLDNGQTYHFKVVAYVGRVPSQPSIAATGTPNLNPPTGLKASSGYESVDLSWNAVSGAKGYRVYYHTDKEVSPDKHKHLGSVAVNPTSITISGLTTGVTHYFIVLAYRNNVNSKASEVVTGTPILASPTGLKATSGYKSVALSWNRVPEADEYIVYYHTAKDVSPNDNDNIGSQAVRGDAATITSLTNGQTYYFIVVAYKGGSSSLPSLVVSAEPNFAPPTKLQATGKNTAIDLTWDAVAGATSYTVYYHTAKFKKTSDSGVKSKTGIKTTNTSITGLTNGTEYYLRVEAISASGETKLSTEIVSATANLLAQPTNLNATGVIKAVDLSWDAVTGATRYTVYYHTASFDSTYDSGVNGIIVAAKTKISIKRLANGTTYYFRVIASNPNGNSALSQIQSATTTLVAPHPSAAASIVSLAAVDLSWDAVAGATGYKIYYAKVSLDDLIGGYLNYAAVGGKDVTTDDTDTSATIGDLSADTTYYFVVAANYHGQKEKAAPELTADSSYIAELAMGGVHGCVRLNTGGIKCWGINRYGQLGVGDTTNRYTATSVDLLAKQLSAGASHSCAIDLNNKLYCWGANWSHQLGLSDSKLNRSSPTLVKQDNLDEVSLVTASRGHTTCALADGNNYCWGSQEFGALGNGVASNDSTMDAQKIKDITSDVKQFALGDHSGCAIDANDALWCWGYNYYGQVGDGTDGRNANRPSPVKPKLQGSSFATMVAGGFASYCAVDNANKVQCWGWNNYGQLGIDSTTDSNSPQYVLASTTKSDHLSGVSKITVGDLHSCALITGGSVRCWGHSYYGAIGDATTDRLVADTDMQGINNAIDIAAGYYHTCVLLADRARVKCWGINYYGQLGRGTTSHGSPTPMEVKGL